MAKVVIDISNRERIYINPSNGQRLPKLTRGIDVTSETKTNNLGDGGTTMEAGTGTEEKTGTQEV